MTQKGPAGKKTPTPIAMKSIEDEFSRELGIFRGGAESGAQFFYSYLAVHELAKRDRRLFRLLDENALFWNTALGGLQTGAIMALGRIFDHRSPHNLNTLVRLVSQHRGMFAKTALGKRNRAPRASRRNGSPSTYAQRTNQHRPTFAGSRITSRNTDESTKTNTTICATSSTRTNKPPTLRRSRRS